MQTSTRTPKHNNKMFSSGFVTYGMYLIIAGKKGDQNLTTGKVLNSSQCLEEGHFYE